MKHRILEDRILNKLNGYALQGYISEGLVVFVATVMVKVGLIDIRR